MAFDYFIFFQAIEVRDFFLAQLFFQFCKTLFKIARNSIIYGLGLGSLLPWTFLHSTKLSPKISLIFSRAISLPRFSSIMTGANPILSVVKDIIFVIKRQWSYLPIFQNRSNPQINKVAINCFDLQIASATLGFYHYGWFHLHHQQYILLPISLDAW